MSEDPLVLSIDLGTSGAKCALVRLSGRIVAWDFHPVETQMIGNDGAEQHPDDWWRAVCRSARGVIQKFAATRQQDNAHPPAGDEAQATYRALGSDQIAAVCASTQGEGTVPVDQDGTPLHPALLWLDMRGRQALAQAASTGLVRIAGYNARKLARWIRLTGGAPALSGKDPAGHMLYVKQELPEIYQKTYKFLNVIDYLNFRMTGRMAAPPDSIMTSWVTDNRDPSRIRYHADLIAGLGVDADKLPEIIGATEIVGNLTGQAAEQLGLPAGVPVVTGTIDTSAAAIGSGEIADGRVHLYVGTSSWLGAHVPWKRTNPIAQIGSVPCARDDKYLMIAMQSAAGSNLAFLRDQVFFNRDELLQHDELPDVYRLLDLIAERVPAGARGILYTPWLFGERCPVDDATARAGFLNLSMQHSREDMIRAVLEGVALNTRWMLGSVKKFLRAYPLEEITIVGGGGASDVWCQIFADVMNVKIRQLETPIQANVLGTAFIAGVGIGAMSFDDVPARTKAKAVYQPNGEHVNIYDRTFASFTDAYKRLAPLYRRLNRPTGGKGR